jgi:hypothetical protein
MSKINLLSKLLTQYKLWNLTLQNATNAIENNILQNDVSDKVVEKIVSIGISTIFVYLLSGLIGLFGIATGGAGWLAFFVLGFVLSKLANKKIFGNPRTFESISEEEKILLNTLYNLNAIHKNIAHHINSNHIKCHFTNYAGLKRGFDDAVRKLDLYDTKPLALKYRAKYPFVLGKYKAEVSKFHSIYANKG